MTKHLVCTGIRRAHRTLDAAFMLGAPNGTTVPQLAVLQALKEGGAMLQTELVARTGIDRSTMAAMLKGMVDRGTVGMTRGSNGDYRSITVLLLPTGRNVTTSAEKRLTAAEDALLKLVTAADRPAFLRGLAVMADIPVPHGRKKKAR